MHGYSNAQHEFEWKESEYVEGTDQLGNSYSCKQKTFPAFFQVAYILLAE